MEAFIKLLYLIYLGVALFLFFLYASGVYHAFQSSFALGVVSIFVPPVTTSVEFLDWASTKDLWKELATLLGV